MMNKMWYNFYLYIYLILAFTVLIFIVKDDITFRI